MPQAPRLRMSAGPGDQPRQTRAIEKRGRDDEARRRYRYGFVARYLKPLVFDLMMVQEWRQYEVARWLGIPDHALSEYLTTLFESGDQECSSLIRMSKTQSAADSIDGSCWLLPESRAPAEFCRPRVLLLVRTRIPRQRLRPLRLQSRQRSVRFEWPQSVTRCPFTIIEPVA